MRDEPKIRPNPNNSSQSEYGREPEETFPTEGQENKPSQPNQKGKDNTR